MDACRKRYGETFSITFPGFETPMVIISHPDDVARLFKERSHGLPPGRSVALEPLLGSRSVLLLEGPEHLARRKLMLPPFHGERMRAYESTMIEIIEREIDRWPIGEQFPIHPRMQAVTLEVILEAVFGVSDPARLARLRTLLGGLLDSTSGQALQVRFLLSQRIGRMQDPLQELRRSLAEADEILAAEAAERRADPNLAEREDILSLLVAARFEDGEPMSDGELRDQLMTLLIAGHETTATALAWTFDLLLRNPAVLARLRADLRDGSEEYLRATISEGLRLRPVIPLAGRRLATDFELSDRVLPPGTDVTPAIWLTHTRPETYPDPLAFRPERFLDNPPETYSWIPFGGGIRRCLGAAFAEFEMRVVLRSVLERCDLESARSRPQRIARRNITFSPRNGTPVRLRSRAAAPELTAA
jgi:cytochrome P450